MKDTFYINKTAPGFVCDPGLWPLLSGFSIYCHFTILYQFGMTMENR